MLLLFANADELMSFVEELLLKPNDLPESLLDDRSKYHAYFNGPKKYKGEDLPKIVYLIYKTLLRIPDVKKMFQTKRSQRFLMHLIGHHVSIPLKVRESTNPMVDYRPFSLAESSVCTRPMSLNGYFTTSNDINNINCQVSSDGKRIMVKAIKEIKKGNSLTLSHLD